MSVILVAMTKVIKEPVYGAGHMVLAALPEDLNLVPNTLIRHPLNAYNSSPRGSEVPLLSSLSTDRRVVYAQETHRRTRIHIHNVLKLNFKEQI